MPSSVCRATPCAFTKVSSSRTKLYGMYGSSPARTRSLNFAGWGLPFRTGENNHRKASSAGRANGRGRSPRSTRKREWGTAGADRDGRAGDTRTQLTKRIRAAAGHARSFRAPGTSAHQHRPSPGGHPGARRTQAPPTSGTQRLAVPGSAGISSDGA